MNEQLAKKVEQAVKLLRTAAGDDIVEISFSGGKDSEVILELAKMAGIKFRAIYKNTTIDPPGTIKHCIEKGVEIMQPRVTFLKLVEKKGMPTRRARFCCEKMKEYKILDKAVQGVRRAESTARTKRYSEEDPVICRIYGSKKNHVSVILPILSWSDEEVAEFIAERGIKCHPLYYDAVGKFHAERRLGCIGCPLRSDAGVGEYKEYPKLFKQVVKAVIVWWETHPNTKSIKRFGTPYGLIAHNLFYKSYEKWRADDNNLFGKTDWKIVLERIFDTELPEWPRPDTPSKVLLG